MSASKGPTQRKEAGSIGLKVGPADRYFHTVLSRYVRLGISQGVSVFYLIYVHMYESFAHTFNHLFPILFPISVGKND